MTMSSFLLNDNEASRMLRDILQLTSHPVAVKLVKVEDSLERLPPEPRKRLRYCQGLMEARRGQSLTLTKETLSCPAAAAAFGFSPLPDKIKKGEMLKSLGLFESEEAAANLMKQMPRLKQGAYKAVSLAPLEGGSFMPDVTVIEDDPEKIMWINLASIHDTGDRISFSSSIFQACCVDVTVIPFLTGKVNACFGCYGCREATNLKDEEGLVGIPFEKLEEIVRALQALSIKAMPSVRKKGVYNLFIKSLTS